MGGGSVIRTPSVGWEIIGQVVSSWFMRAWAQSRAVEERMESVGDGVRGLASLQRRLPRSKV